MAETVDFESSGGQEDAGAQADVARIASLNARAVMPDGRTLSRAEILQNLGLNPNTNPTAWLAIVACGSNASALRPGDLQRIAVDRVMSASRVLQGVQDVQDATATERAEGGFSAGGTGPA